MSFQTNVLQDGQWVTQTVDLNAVLKASNSKAVDRAPRIPVAKPPRCGILTRTVVESPVVRQVLPCRLRCAQRADVAFVGDYFVEIREYRMEDGQLHDVIRREDFDERIRKAIVIGNLPDSLGLPANKGAATPYSSLNTGDEDVEMLNSSSQSCQKDGQKELLAPQMLLIILENCKCIFMVLRTNSDGTVEFVTSQCSISPEGSNSSSFGQQLAVDPTSRYIALASSDSTFTVCELEPRHVLESRYRDNDDLRPIKRFRPRTYNGVLQMIEFLFPKKGNEGEVILLLFIVRGGHTRMVLYDWEAGEHLLGALSQEANGHRLSTQHQLPLFLIPLRVGTSFIAVYRDIFCIVKDAQLAPPEFTELIVESKPPSEYYTGNATPLWASWARPFRLSQYGSDCIYIAREDGCVDMLFVNDDVEVEASPVGRMRCSVSAAFGVLFDDTPSDILVAAGDAGPGVVWKVKARAAPEYLMHIPNWAPALDIVTTHENQISHKIDARGRSLGSMAMGSQHNPDRVFATSGKAASGTVMEYRHGLQADIGVQLECDPTTTKAWLLPVRTTAPGSGNYLILTTPDRSTLLHLSDDLTELSCPDADMGFDLFSQTYVVHALSERAIVQVTETHIACVTAPSDGDIWPLSQAEQRHMQQAEDIFQTPPTSVQTRLRDLFPHISLEDDMVFTHAAALGDFVLLSATTNHSTQIYLCRIMADLSPFIVRSFPVQGEVTCLASGMFHGARYIFAGLWRDNMPSLARLSLDGLDAGRLQIIPVNTDPFSSSPPLSSDSSSIPQGTIGGYVSISTAEIDGFFIIILGTREGSVITVALRGDESVVRNERFGLTPVTTSDFRIAGRSDMVTVCCESKLWVLSNFDSKRTKCFKNKHRVWPVDTHEMKPTEGSKQTPAPCTLPIISVTALDSQLARTPQHLPLMVVTGNQIVLAELLLKPQQVPWRIPLGVTPTTAIYSRVLDCIVVGVIDEANKTTLKFIDLETGKDISYPFKQDDDLPQYVAGLGVKGDTILSLSEWFYQKSKHTFAYILVGSRSAGIQVISATNVPDGRTGGKRIIKYYTRFKRKASEPVHCIIGHQDGIVYCQGSTLKWEILDSVQKKLGLWRTFDLRSPAKSLSVWDGSIAQEEQDQTSGRQRDSAGLSTRSDKTGKGKQKAADGDLSEPEEEPSKESDENFAQNLERRLASHIIVTTMHHSVIVLSHRDDKATEMTHSHSDPFERQGLYSIRQGNIEGSSIYLTTDITRALTGLWVPWRQPGCNCEVLFEAELPSSVRKMVAARTRPGWAAAQRTAGYGILKFDNMETLGISVDGRLQHFQMIGIEAWAVLRLVVNLAMATQEICPFIWQYAAGWQKDPEPVDDGGFMLQVDGNIVRRVLEKRALEMLFENDEHFVNLVQKLRGLDMAEAENGGIWHMAGLLPPPEDPVMERREVFFELVYAIMEYYLSPVL